ncbi:hypothetical protein TD95_000805 [Thielaviopsis punctulata]|uniref:G-patch domain-containing protein n=1 Tax=Thielaviopsis punctulata TaxID=72032 RepID=A0A0F4ZLW3_9PEZI|nr:hypothetical protein TD95_000805 [Thielaviopsis punctulata]
MTGHLTTDPTAPDPDPGMVKHHADPTGRAPRTITTPPTITIKTNAPASATIDGVGSYIKNARSSRIAQTAELSYDDAPVAEDAEDGQIWEDKQSCDEDYEKDNYDYERDDYDYENNDGYERPRGRRYDGRRDGRYRDLDRDGGAGRYTRRRRDYSKSPRRRHSRSRSPPGRGKPTDTIIVEGILETLTLNELRTSFYASTDLVDFPTAQVRAPGALSDSIKWMEQNYPSITLEFPGRTDISNEKLTCMIHYARSRVHEPSSTYEDKRATLYEEPQRPQLTGDTDASPTPSQILVIYPLLPSVNEEALAAGALQLEKDEKSTVPRADGAPKLKSTAPVGDTTGLGAPKGSLHRVFLIRDTATNASLNYGFVEFWTLDAAMAAMAKFQKSRTFTIAGATVVVSTIHLGVFVPDTRPLVPQIEKQSFHPLFNPAIRVRYRDLHVYPSIRIVSEEPPSGMALPKTDAVEDEAKKSKKRKGDTLQAGPAKRPVMAGQMAMWQKKHAEIAEPHADSPAKSSANCIPVSARPAPIKISIGTKAIASPSPQVPSVTAFLDRDRLQCLLCMMKYKTLDDCDVHERSRNHKGALRDADKVKAATARVLARQGKKVAESDAGYRDRARERRAAFNQPPKPGAASAKKDSASTATATAVPTMQDKTLPAVSGKGSSLLAKMGWTKGMGLGAKGEGRTDIVVTHAYQEGVGLGADGGDLGDAQLLAEKKTIGRYEDYVESAQDRARQRYKKLDS